MNTAKRSVKQNNSIAVISPGLLPIPPVLGGSVETVIQEMANITKKKYTIDIYGPIHRTLPQMNSQLNMNYYRFPIRPYSDYFKKVRADLEQKNYAIIQVENRPLFIPKTKKNNPGSKFILSLHSLDHIHEKLIKPQLVGSIFNQCDSVLVYSKYIADTLINHFPKQADKIRFIHLGVNPKTFQPRWEPKIKAKTLLLKKKMGIHAEDKVLLFAGRVIPKKGIHHIISAMKEILNLYPAVTLVIVGGSWYNNHKPTEYIAKIRRQAARYGHKIIFTNYVRNADLPLLFAMSDIFLCPSQWDEPFGLVNVEAMAAGLPVVASDRGGISEIITNGINGYLVRNENDPRSFVAPIVNLLQNPCIAGAFGRNGRKLADEYFNWTRAGQQLIQLYEKLLSI